MGDTPETSSTPAEGSPDLRPKAYRILLVDDEEDIRESLETFLRSEIRNIDVRTAASGDEALESLREDPVDLIITDQKMPGMTGLELLLAAKEEVPNMVRIIMTAFPDVKIATQAINEGRVDRFFTKPLDPDEVVTTVQSLLKDRRHEELRRQAFNRSLDEMRKRLGQTEDA